jgi:K+-sensing histidine kinase KdpD
MELNMNTYFAAPERVTPAELSMQVKLASEDTLISALLHSISGMLAIVNEQRQVIAINDNLLQALGITDPGACLGLRPGEILKCIYAHDEPAGCGTTRMCATCGAAVAMVASLTHGQPVEKTCAMTTSVDGKINNISLLIQSNPVQIDGKRYLLLFLQDITVAEKRAALERTFFHDINNILQMLLSASELLKRREPSRLATNINDATLRLVREVEIQRHLMNSDTGPLSTAWRDVQVSEIIQNLQSFFSDHPAAKGKHLVVAELTEDPIITTDIALVMRVLSNMVLNAFEATDPDGIVIITAERHKTSTSFHVWNNRPIPDSIRERVFQRNFTTKDGPGRGIGTYSMKLFGEDFLGGKVDFTSSLTDGTIFTLTLPVSGESKKH